MPRILILLIVLKVSTSSAENCDQVLTKKQFILESPQYPSNYPLSYHCSYLIKGPSCPTEFNLQLLDFNLENSTGCAKDRLEVENKDAICGSRSGVKKYFSDSGNLILRFVSDQSVTGRGFRILVTRSDCDNASSTVSTSSTVPKWYTTNKDVEYATTTTRSVFITRRPSFESKSCCQNVYNAKQLTIMSPRFPYSMSSPTNCVFQIRKNNSNVCRLRIHVRFFYLGPESSGCSTGYLQVDNKIICGCKDGNLKLISPFGSSDIKVFNYVSAGLEKNSYTGFVLEVIQDECPKRTEVPSSSDEMNNGTTDKFRYYNDQINRVSFPKDKDQTNESHRERVIEKLRLINENTEVIPESYVGPKIIKHFYYFDGGSDFNNYQPRDREETTYVDSSSSGHTLQDFNPDDDPECLNWNRLRIDNLLRAYNNANNNEGCLINNEGDNLGSNDREGNHPNKNNCVDLSFERGYFKSPGYPLYYPGSLNVCYRFNKMPGYCMLQVHMKDFAIESSPDCDKDYLLMGTQFRYCGTRLWNTVSTLDMTHKPYEEVHFVTDTFRCGRGFYGTYEQIRCPDGPDLMPRPINTCQNQEIIQGESFTLDIFDYSSPCSYRIRKYSEDVCAVRLYFEKFDLFCAVESIVIDGTMYCGHLSGQSAFIDVFNEDGAGLLVLHKKISGEGAPGLRARIKGVQLVNDCPDYSVPAQRLLNKPSTYLLKIRESDSCILVTPIDGVKNPRPSDFCGFILENKIAIKCLSVDQTALRSLNFHYPPSQQSKFLLKLKPNSIIGGEENTHRYIVEAEANKVACGVF